MLILFIHVTRLSSNEIFFLELEPDPLFYYANALVMTYSKLTEPEFQPRSIALP